MKNFIFGLFVLLFLYYPPVVHSAAAPSTTDDYLELLDKELAHRREYMAVRQHKVDSVKRIIKTDSVVSFKDYLTLGDLIGPINADSAIVAFSLGYDAAIGANDSAGAQRCMISRITELRKLNSTPEAVRDMMAISRFGIYDENKEMYYRASRDMYYTIAEIFEGSFALYLAT